MQFQSDNIHCNNCGEEVISHAKFCTKCGISLSIPSVLDTNNDNSFEILSESSNKTHPRPWIRYWARIFDAYCFGLIGAFILLILAPQFFEGMNDHIFGILLVFVWVFIESLLLSTIQTTPGKWLFKIKLRLSSSSSINFLQALRRSFKVWFNGLAIGFPILVIFTMISAYRKLTVTGKTSWDENEGFEVTHEKIGLPRILVIITIFIVIFALMLIGTTYQNINQ